MEDSRTSPQFAPVKDIFLQLFNDGRSRGCAVAAWWRGEQVVNLFGGWSDRELSQPWQHNTLVNVFSASKPFVAAAILQLVEQEKLALDAPVCEYWPDFGKPEITPRLALNHRMGLAALDDQVADDDIYDWPKMMVHLERMRPLWPPREAQGYHPFVYGWVLGELIRRITGKMPGEYIADHICRPHGIDFHMGLSDTEINRVAAVLPKATAEPSAETASEKRAAERKPAKPENTERSLLDLALNQPASLSRGSNREVWRRAHIPAANGHATAAGLAKFYQSLMVGDVINAESLAMATAISSCEKDKTLGFELPLGLGFWVDKPGSPIHMGRGVGAYGHPGAGGSVGFADPEHELAFGFVTRDLGGSMLMGGKASRFAEAIYACL